MSETLSQPVFKGEMRGVKKLNLVFLNLLFNFHLNDRGCGRTKKDSLPQKLQLVTQEIGKRRKWVPPAKSHVYSSNCRQVQCLFVSHAYLQHVFTPVVCVYRSPRLLSKRFIKQITCDFCNPLHAAHCLISGNRCHPLETTNHHAGPLPCDCETRLCFCKRGHGIRVRSMTLIINDKWLL